MRRDKKYYWNMQVVHRGAPFGRVAIGAPGVSQDIEGFDYMRWWAHQGHVKVEAATVLA